ncbi:LSR2-like protein [Williamsia muralis]|uniref:histone-like nucleoid-structuring protein Lsr2 n=1 Tax=Williamsia marianensis TaxID=85044 RepID=UPI0039E8A2AC
MAKKIVVEFVDDLDGASLASDDVQTVEWSWRGVDYVIDTSATNLDKIENGKVPFTKVLTNSTRMGGRRRSPVRSRPTPGTHGAAVDVQQRALIRDWARAHGYNVGIRGRISADIVAAYHEQSSAQ